MEMCRLVAAQVEMTEHHSVRTREIKAYLDITQPFFSKEKKNVFVVVSLTWLQNVSDFYSTKVMTSLKCVY